MGKQIGKKLNKFIKTNQKEIDMILNKHNIPVLSLRPGKRKIADDGGTTGASYKRKSSCTIENLKFKHLLIIYLFFS